MEDIHYEESDWKVRLIDQAEKVTILGGETLIPATSWIHFSQMD